VVPLETVYIKEDYILTGRSIWKVIGETLSDEDAYIFVCPLVLFAIVGFIPSLFYRISFKATSLAYAPFVWVAHTTLQSAASAKLRLERITKGELEKTRRWLSGFVATALAVKFALARGWIDLTAALAQFPSKTFVQSLLVPNVWFWWQFTLGIDALMTFCLLYYADAALARLEGVGAWREESVTKTISTASFLRASLGIVTMSYFFYVGLTSALRLHRP